MHALADAERAKTLGDIADAFRIANGALQEDPENEDLLALRAALARQMEMRSQRERVDELVEKSERALAAGDYDAAGTLLNELVEIGPSNPKADKLRQELAEYRELEQSQTVLERTRIDVQDFIKSDAYDQAFALISQALAQYPDELLLHRLKAEVEAGERRYDFTRVVDMVIARAK
jgi:tetratricopeptide (TPR) repeat protein